MRPWARTAFALAFFAANAAADDDPAMVQARDAYARGASAYDAQEYAKAAVELARADQLAPNMTALELALQAADRAHNAPLAMELADRVDTRVSTAPQSVIAKARDVHARYATEVGAIVVRCPSPAICKASLDGRAAPIDVSRWASPGAHLVDVEVDGALQHLPAHVDAQQTTEVKPTPPPPKLAEVIPRPVPPLPLPPIQHTPPPSRKLSPAWFWIAGGTTLVMGGATTWSAIDTQTQHNAYEKSPSTSAQTTGRSAQIRTNVFIGITAGLAVLTGTLGIFFVGWSHGPEVAINGRF